MKKVAIIGSTGSIGTQALDVIRKHSEKLKVVALTAGQNVELLIRQAKEFEPEYVAIADEKGYPQIVQNCSCWTGQGMEAVASLAALNEVDLTLIAVSGAAGIRSTHAAVSAGKTVGLANKESLVAAGSIIMALAARKDAVIIPVDSEHSAVFQCLKGEEKTVHRIWLTASGGPFRDSDRDEMENVTRGDALRHPKWNMGAKITIDSATLMNKGLEVIEAHHLFGLSYDKISVVIHPQSIVHSMVEFVDGALLGQLGVPDMRIPIQYAFSYPERWEPPTRRLDLFQMGRLDFLTPDTVKFPALDLAYSAGKTGGTMPAAMNAANEVAVNYFLQDKIGFLEIIKTVENVMKRHNVVSNPDLKTILEADQWAREMCVALLQGRG